MLLATWNVNSITVRTSHLISWLEKVSPDILCLQETKIVDEKFPKEPFEAAGYQCAFYGERTYNGVAILSKYPLEKLLKGFKEEVSPAACRFIEAQIGPGFVRQLVHNALFKEPASSCFYGLA